MTKFSSLILMMLLSWRPASGQGFILVDSVPLNDLDFEDVSNLDSYYHPELPGLVVTTMDSVFVYQTANGKVVRSASLNTSSVLGFETNSLQTFDGFCTQYTHSDEFVYYSFNSGAVLSKIEIQPEIHKSIEYSFQDEDHLYLISYYNRAIRDVDAQHDLVQFFKLNKQTQTVIHSATLDIGKEIILAPLNHQLIAFNGKYFILADRVKHQLRLIDTDFLVYDIIALNSELGERNQKLMDTIFPDQNVRYYLHRPKMVIDHFATGAGSMSMIKSVICLNPEQLLMVYQHGIFPTHTFSAEIIQLDKDSLIAKFDIPFRGHPLSPLTWTRKVYPSQSGQFLTVNLVRKDTQNIYTLKRWSYSTAKAVDRGILRTFKLRNIEGDTVDIQSYSGVVLADQFYCKGCYASEGTGKGVLVITKRPWTEATLRSIHRKHKRTWNVKGALVYIDESQFNQLSSHFPLNQIIPFKVD